MKDRIYLILTIFILVGLNASCGKAPSIKDALVQSCLKQTDDLNPDLDNGPMCECMAEELITNEMVTEEFRQKLAIDWGGGMDLENQTNLNEKDGAELGMAFVVWGNCMKKLHPEFKFGQP